MTDSYGDPFVAWEDSKAMTSAQIIALFHFDHYPIRVEAGGPTEPWNLVPRLREAHQIKTSKIDIPEIAKIKRVSKEQEEFARRMLTPKDQREPRKSKWPKKRIVSKASGRKSKNWPTRSPR